MRKTILKTTITSLALVGFMSPLAHAQWSAGPSPVGQGDIRALNISSDWQNGTNTVTVGEDGKVIFPFGEAQPTVICAPLMICDIELEQGEKALNIIVGDTVQWKFEGARSGPEGSIPHILVKVKREGLQTTMVVTTDRRTYHILLKSNARKYMARVGFDYGFNTSTVLESMASIPQPVTVTPEPVKVVEFVPTLPGFKSVDELDFGYDIKASRKVKFKPLRVFNDGVKTYIEFDEDVVNSELPIFQVKGSDKNRAIVNSRFVDNRFIVDQVFDEGILIFGVGSKQRTVTIKRDKA